MALAVRTALGMFDVGNRVLIRRRFRPLHRRRLLSRLMTTMARRATLTSRFPCLVDCPLVRSALRVCGLAAFARDAPLFFRIHRSKPTILFRHGSSPSDYVPVVLWMQKKSQLLRG